MSKMKISWHEEGLQNRIIYYNSRMEQLKRLEEDLKRSKEEIDFIAHQIRTARKKNLIEYDCERFLVKKLK